MLVVSFLPLFSFLFLRYGIACVTQTGFELIMWVKLVLNSKQPCSVFWALLLTGVYINTLSSELLFLSFYVNLFNCTVSIKGGLPCTTVHFWRSEDKLQALGFALLPACSRQSPCCCITWARPPASSWRIFRLWLLPPWWYVLGYRCVHYGGQSLCGLQRFKVRSFP